jgi:hypothetical protein
MAQILSIEPSYLSSLPQVDAPTVLCHRCRDLQLWRPTYSFTDVFGSIRARSSDCQLCSLIRDALSSEIVDDGENILIYDAPQYEPLILTS